MKKELMKNREVFIRHLYAQPPHKDKRSSYIHENDLECLCAKGRAVELFMSGIEERREDLGPNIRRFPWLELSGGPGRVPDTVMEALLIPSFVWHRMESIYEAARIIGDTNPYHEAARYLESLPGWPSVFSGGER